MKLAGLQQYRGQSTNTAYIETHKCWHHSAGVEKKEKISIYG